jgi:hypothetical protein
MISERVADRFLSIGLYTLIGLGIVWFGSRMVNYALDVHFYNDYLLGWEMALTEYRHQSGGYPKFNGGNHMKYMQQMMQRMTQNMSVLPKSNTEFPFLYRIDKIGYETQRVFLLALSDRMVLYNLPAGTINRLDKMVDGHEDLDKGLLTGRKSKDGVTYIGSWKL